MLINGLVTFRVFGKQKYFKKNLLQNVEKGANVTFGFIVATRWMSVRLDLISTFFIIFTTILCILLKDYFMVAYLQISLQLMVDITLCIN